MKLEFAIEHIDLSVNEQSMRLLGNNELVANSVNYVYAHFRFPDEWKGLRKQVHFKQPDPVAIHIILFLDDNDSVLVPHEVLDHKGAFTVHLVGTGNGVTITTNPLTVYVRDNGILTPDNNATPTPNFLIDTVAQVAADREYVEGIVKDAERVAEEAAIKAADTASQNIIASTSAYVDEAKQEIYRTKDLAIESVNTTSTGAISNVQAQQESSITAIQQAQASAETALSNVQATLEGLVDEASTSASNALASENNAKTYRDEAEGFKNQASSYNTSAKGYSETASTKAGEASASASLASTKASAASTSEANALAYKNDTASLVDGFDTKVTNASSDLESARTTALGEINTAKTGALGDISSSKTSALSDISTSKTNATRDITALKTATETSVGDLVSSVGEYSQNATNEADRAKQEADRAEYAALNSLSYAILKTWTVGDIE